MDLTDRNLSALIVDYLKRNHPGRDRAIPYKGLMAIFAVADDGKDNHHFRKLYENRVGSCAQGIYHIRGWAEYAVWHAYLERTYGKSMADKKGRAFLANRPDLKRPATPPATQPSLFNEAEAQ